MDMLTEDPTTIFSVAYWYQTEPHAAFPSLPPVEERLPRLHARRSGERCEVRGAGSDGANQPLLRGAGVANQQ
jgi:hypothetical protein